MDKYWQNTYIFSRSRSPVKAPFGMTLILVRMNLLKIEKMEWLFTVHTGLCGSLANTPLALIPGEFPAWRLHSQNNSYNVCRIPDACLDQNYSAVLGCLWCCWGKIIHQWVASSLLASVRNKHLVTAALLHTWRELCLFHLILSFERCSSTGWSNPVEFGLGWVA